MSQIKAKNRFSPPESFSGFTREELRTWVADHGESAYRGDQIFQWAHAKWIQEPSAMKNVPGKLKNALEEMSAPALKHTETLYSMDGTRKLLLETADGHRLETVLIPMGDFYTQCVSTQVGCRLGCTFCLTATLGLSRHLGAHEIVDQVHIGRSIDLGDQKVRNYVFMGMGEPLDNMDQLVRACRIMLDEKGLNISSRRVTVSTAGLANKIPDLGHEVPVNLAISLNGSTDEQRSKIMPINRKYNMAELKKALLAFPLPQRRRITIEYVMLGGFNDSEADAHRLAKYLHGLRVKVNLIPWNPFEEGDYTRPSDQGVRSFQSILVNKGIATSIRISKGLDIGAACGQLDGLPGPETELPAE